ncbi:MAG: hypothetical protein EA408_11805 [Marinilabiliales bacterium]|nr:MAG: hypothetical protein EA408_11805 [Marinilabiliales bacterium]
MKQFVYISGTVSTNMLLLGAIFKMNHWPASNILLVVSILLFGFVFLPAALLSSYNAQEQKKYKWLHIVTFIAFAISLTAALFKIMHWPGAGVLLLFGIPLPFVIFLPVYLYSTRDVKNQSPALAMGVMFGLTFLAVFSVMLSLRGIA